MNERRGEKLCRILCDIRSLAQETLTRSWFWGWNEGVWEGLRQTFWTWNFLWVLSHSWSNRSKRV
jgi:hypothetical protein